MYQSAYSEGFTTSPPSHAELTKLLESGFSGHEKDYRTYIDILDALGVGEGAKLLDFGCSWGYGSYQLQRAGFDVQSCEISAPRGAYAADKLGVRVCVAAELPDETLDVFFSAHVIEHVPSVSLMLELGMRLLRPGGLLVTFTPNFSLQRRARDPSAWHRNWGYVHPQGLDSVFLSALPFENLLALSSPYDLGQLRQWGRKGRQLQSMGGDELLFAICKAST